MNNALPSPAASAASAAGAIIEHPELGLLLQLRDEYAPTNPLHWGVFGGQLEAGETPEVALWRELAEELQFVPEMVVSHQLFQVLDLANGSQRYYFHLLTQVTIEQLVLGEGKLMHYAPLHALHPPQPYAGHAFAPNTGRVLATFLAARRNQR